MTKDQRSESMVKLTKNAIKKRMQKIDPDEWAYDNKSPCLECGKKSCQWKKCVPYKWFISKTWRRVTEPFRG